MPKVSEYKQVKGRYWHGSPFFTHYEGYKLRVVIAANSHAGDGVMSVYVYRMQGDFDDKLTWPLKATVTLQLIDPTGQHQPYMKKLRGEWKRCFKEKTGDRLSWCPFITHAELEKYINNDTLHFRIVVVKRT